MLFEQVWDTLTLPCSPIYADGIAMGGITTDQTTALKDVIVNRIQEERGKRQGDVATMCSTTSFTSR